MRAHPGYRILWLVQQTFGIVTSLWLGWWHEYFYATGVLEFVGLARSFALGRTSSGTFSWVQWDFLEDGTGFRTWPRVVLVSAWVLWFTGAFALHGVFPRPWLNALVAFLGLAWLANHFLGRSVRPPLETTAPTHPGDRHV